MMFAFSMLIAVAIISERSEGERDRVPGFSAFQKKIGLINMGLENGILFCKWRFVEGTAFFQSIQFCDSIMWIRFAAPFFY
jgi:hypothetical protein